MDPAGRFCTAQVAGLYGSVREVGYKYNFAGAPTLLRIWCSVGFGPFWKGLCSNMISLVIVLIRDVLTQVGTRFHSNSSGLRLVYATQ